MATLPTLVGTVHLPAGEYAVPQTIAITEPVTVVCDPGVVISRPTLGYLFRAESSNVRWIGAGFRCATPNRGSVVFDPNVPVGTQQRNSDWSFDHCTFDNFCLHFSSCDHRRHDGVLATKGIDIGSDVRVRDCTFRNIRNPWPLKFDGVRNFLVDGCQFTDIGGEAYGGGNGIKVSAGSRDYRLTNNYIRHTYRSGIDLFDSHRGIVTGNTIDGTDDGIGIIVKAGVTVSGDPIEWLNISHNFVSGTKYAGISAETDRCTVSGNQCVDCGGSGVRYHVKTGSPSTRSQRGVVSGNIIERCQIGIQVNGDWISVVANQCHTNRAQGIYVKGEHNEVVANGASGNGKQDIQIISATEEP
jgi:parallel beta-helix repeat protein